MAEARGTRQGGSHLSTRVEEIKSSLDKHTDTSRTSPRCSDVKSIPHSRVRILNVRPGLDKSHHRKMTLGACGSQSVRYFPPHSSGLAPRLRRIFTTASSPKKAAACKASLPLIETPLLTRSRTTSHRTCDAAAQSGCLCLPKTGWISAPTSISRSIMSMLRLMMAETRGEEYQPPRPLTFAPASSNTPTALRCPLSAAAARGSRIVCTECGDLPRAGEGGRQFERGPPKQRHGGHSGL